MAMPYPADHKKKTRMRIVECARILFNRHGFVEVSIDDVMAEAGLTRGGFYNHFKNKEELFAEAITCFLEGRGAEMREQAGVDLSMSGPTVARQMIEGYLSSEHLDDLDGQCPMIALPSDVARASPAIKASYLRLLEAMVGLFEQNLPNNGSQARQQALSLAALCVGGMVLARTLDDATFADELRGAALSTALAMSGDKGSA